MSACYAYIGALTAYLKTYYPVEFMAAVLTHAKDSDEVAKYIKSSEKMGITIAPPDINVSKSNFTPQAEENKILFGLSSVKGVGGAAIPEIVSNAPYTSFDDALERLPKSVFKKNVATSLIEAGAFDFDEPNRYVLLNKLNVARKTKDFEPFPEDLFDEEVIMEFEKMSLGTYITYKPWWENIKENEKVEADGFIAAPNERKDRKGGLMAFPAMVINGCRVEGLIFASNYRKCALEVQEFYTNKNFTFHFVGKKDEKGKLMLNSITLNHNDDDEAEAC